MGIYRFSALIERSIHISDLHAAGTDNPVYNLVVTGGNHNSTPMGGVFLHDPEYFDLAFGDVGSLHSPYFQIIITVMLSRHMVLLI